MDEYPNDGSLFQDEIIDEREEQENKERADTQSSAPILDELIQNLREDIAKAEIDAMRMMNVGMGEMEIKGILSGTDRYKTKLQGTLERLQDMQSRYIQ